MKGGITLSEKVIRRFRAACRLASVLGFLFLYSTVGAADMEMISDLRLVVQGMIGLAVFAGGAWFGGMIQWP